MREWLRLARAPSVVRRARVLEIALTLLVPYAVSTTSSVSALRAGSPR